MEDLDDVMCSIIQEITDYHIDSVIELNHGIHLNLLLEKINPVFFEFEDTNVLTWDSAEAMIVKFLQEKKIFEETIDFNIDEIRSGNKGWICHALLQIFAIMVVFNKPFWDEIMKKVGFVVYTQITKSLDSMVKELSDLLDKSQAIYKFGDNFNIGSMLKSLQTKQEIIENQIDEIDTLKSEFAESRTAIQNLQSALKEKEKELEAVTSLKDSILNDIISREDQNMRQTSKAVNQGKIEMMEEKIISQQAELEKRKTTVLDKEMEIEKLANIIKTLEVSKAECEELQERASHYQAIAEETQRHNELLESKLKSLSSIQDLIEELKTELVQEKEKATKLGFDLEDKKAVVETLSKRIELQETSRRKGLKNPSLTEVEDLYSMELFKTMEFENQKFKKRLEELTLKYKALQLQTNESVVREKENRALKAQLASFLSEGDLKNKGPQKATSGSSLDHMAQHSREDLARLSKLRSAETLMDQLNEDHSNDKCCNSPSKSDGDFAQFGVVYTAFMSFYQNEICESRKFIFHKNDRERNMFKQFMLTDVLVGEENGSS